MPQINYFNDNSDKPEEGFYMPKSPAEGAAMMGLSPEGMALYGLKAKTTDLGPSEVLDKTLGEYLNHPAKEEVKAPACGPTDKTDTVLAGMLQLTEEGQKLFDIVNKPRHYNLGKVECIDAIESATIGLHGIQAVCAGNVIKYTWRHHHKNGVQDLEKARFYLDKLISLMKEDKNGHSRKD